MEFLIAIILKPRKTTKIVFIIHLKRVGLASFGEDVFYFRALKIINTLTKIKLRRHQFLKAKSFFTKKFGNLLITQCPIISAISFCSSRLVLITA